MTPAQQGAILEYEQISGFEFMHQDEIASGAMTYRDAWKANVRWLNDMVAEVEHITWPDNESRD